MIQDIIFIRQIGRSKYGGGGGGGERGQEGGLISSQLSCGDVFYISFLNALTSHIPTQGRTGMYTPMSGC